jgi:glutaredoxin
LSDTPVAELPASDRPTWPRILILGRDTCEDTTRSRAHLDGQGIPYAYRRVDREPEADEWIRRLNDDVWLTPTILIGDPQSPDQILREPSNEELDAALSSPPPAR